MITVLVVHCPHMPTLKAKLKFSHAKRVGIQLGFARSHPDERDQPQDSQAYKEQPRKYVSGDVNEALRPRGLDARTGTRDLGHRVCPCHQRASSVS